MQMPIVLLILARLECILTPTANQIYIGFRLINVSTI